MPRIQLKATSARAARLEALQYAPCAIYGWNENGEQVYISFVRPRGDKHPVATATRGEKAVRFEVEPKA